MLNWIPKLFKAVFPEKPKFTVVATKASGLFFPNSDHEQDCNLYIRFQVNGTNEDMVLFLKEIIITGIDKEGRNLNLTKNRNYPNSDLNSIYPTLTKISIPAKDRLDVDGFIKVVQSFATRSQPYLLKLSVTYEDYKRRFYKLPEMLFEIR